MAQTFDAIVVGASIAGCTAATLLARRGARVALLDRVTDPQAYKKVCTHFVQSSAAGTLDRLGLLEKILAAGGVRSEVELCSRFGWIVDQLDVMPVSIRRQTLDPMLRELAAGTPGVELRLGHPVKELTKDGARVTGVRVEPKDGDPIELRAPLVVAADGRHSKLAEMAGVPAKESPHGRFLYAAYWKIPAQGTTARLWLLDPDACYVFPNEDGLSVVVVMPTRDKLPAFRSDMEGSFRRMFDGLPRAPDLGRSERVSDFFGMIEMPNAVRRASAPGIAFVGDAAMASDPMFGVGCGWAFQTGEWLAEDVGDALVQKRGLDEALDTYAEHHRERLRPHHEMLNQSAQGKPFSFVEKLVFSAAAKSASFAHDFAMLTSRFTNPRDVLGPRLLARAVWANLTGKTRYPATLPARAG